MNMQESQLPKGWKFEKVGNITKICLGLTYTPTYIDEGVPFLSVKDISQGNINFENTRFISREEFEKSPEGSKPKKGDVLFGRVGTIGCPQILNEDIEICIFVSLGFFRVNKEILFNQYIAYWMKSNLFSDQVDLNVQGSTLKNLNTGWLKEFVIPLPPLPEQQRIVSILDEAFAAIDKAKANAEQNLKNARGLFESSLKQVFEVKGNDWEEKLLKDIALQFGRGKSKHRPRNWAGLFNGKYPFIQTGDVRNASKYVNDFSQTYNEVGLAQSKLWHKGTICITIAANIAETAILGFDACFPDSIIGLQVNPQKADLDFTYYLLQYFKSELQKLGKGSAQDNINLGTFENKLFPFPKSLEKQQEIVKTLNTLLFETQKLEGIYQQKLQNLEELRKSILQKAFNGEL